MERVVGGKTGVEPAGLLPMVGTFLKIGATGFGGPIAVLALIQDEVVYRRRWFSQEEFEEAMMIGQTLPGPGVVDAIAYMSYRRKGVVGGFLCAGAFLLPSFLLMVALSVMYFRYNESPQVAGAFKGIGAAVVAIVVMAAWRMGRPALQDPRSTALMVAAAGALVILHLPIPLLVLSAGVAGVLIYRNPADLQPKAEGKGDDR